MVTRASSLARYFCPKHLYEFGIFGNRRVAYEEFKYAARASAKVFSVPPPPSPIVSAHCSAVSSVTRAKSRSPLPRVANLDRR